MAKIIALSSPKGGTGKTTLSQNLLVHFAREGMNVLGIDFDPQQTLAKWFKRRETLSNNAPMFDLISLDITDWEKLHDIARHYDVIILDLLPGVEGNITAVYGICELSNLIIVPTGMTMNDLDSTGPWIEQLQRMNFKAVMCMNCARPRESFFIAARNYLNSIGAVCPVEIRQLADAHQFSIDGLAAADKPRCKAYGDFEALFNFTKRESGI